MSNNAKRIKILVIVNASFGFDGISNVATNYYLYQDKSRVEMDLLTINPINAELASCIERDGNRNFVVSGRNRNPFQYLWKLKKIIAENHYDIVHVHGNSATMSVELLAARLAGCKIRIAHSHNTRCDHPKINRILKPLFSALYTDCCACSKEAGEFLFGNRFCYVVNNGLYFPNYRFSLEHRDRIRAEYGLQDKYVIGHIGRFAYQKNQEYLVELLKQMKVVQPNAVLLLVGQGETEASVKELARSCGVEDSVVFYGTTNRVNEVVQAMDVFAFPSRFEGLGIVAIEAQASGLNCVAADPVPTTIQVQDKIAFLPLEGKDDLWVKSLLDLGVSPEDREASAAATQEKLQKSGYDIVRNCKDILDYYESLVESKGK